MCLGVQQNRSVMPIIILVDVCQYVQHFLITMVITSLKGVSLTVPTIPLPIQFREDASRLARTATTDKIQVEDVCKIARGSNLPII